MACPCEVLIDAADPAVAARAAIAACTEAWRVEHKFSRYRDGNIVHAINHAGGQPVTVDAETQRLLDFAAECYAASDGLFDVTSGVLRRVWRFDGSDRLPAPAAVREALEFVGWRRLKWRAPILQMPSGMEIDFGGLGKEYAVDRAAKLASEASGAPLLVNFGGDITATGARCDGSAWQVAIENPASNLPPPRIALKAGGVTTSGDARRYLFKDGVRYGHILDPRDGWPVTDAPRSVTVLDATCSQAGFLSTLAILKGKGAERFLRKHKVDYWLIR